MDDTDTTAGRPAWMGTMRHLMPCRRCGASNGVSAASCWDCEAALQTPQGAWVDTVSPPQVPHDTDEPWPAGTARAGSADGSPADGMHVDAPRPAAMDNASATAPTMDVARAKWPTNDDTASPLPDIWAHRSRVSPRRGRGWRAPAVLAALGVAVSAGVVGVTLWPTAPSGVPQAVSATPVDALAAVAPAPPKAPALPAPSAALALNLESLAAPGAGVSARPAPAPLGRAPGNDPLAAAAVASSCTANVAALGLCTLPPLPLEDTP